MGLSYVSDVVEILLGSMSNMDGLECSTLDNHSDEVLCCCRLSVNGNSSWFEVVDSGHWQMLPSSPNL